VTVIQGALAGVLILVLAYFTDVELWIISVIVTGIAAVAAFVSAWTGTLREPDDSDFYGGGNNPPDDKAGT
jgi:hypothetical protein